VTVYSSPGVPTSVSISENDSTADLTWAAPFYDGDTPITAYKVFVAAVDTVTYYEETTDCVAVAILNELACSLKFSTLYAAPYSLGAYDGVSAYVVAVNDWGESVASAVVSMAVTIFVPDAPTAFV
jgi:hypothetical protein